MIVNALMRTANYFLEKWGKPDSYLLPSAVRLHCVDLGDNQP